MPAPTSIVCPDCGRRSYNPNDVDHGWCGGCHTFTRGPLAYITDTIRLCRDVTCTRVVDHDHLTGWCPRHTPYHQAPGMSIARLALLVATVVAAWFVIVWAVWGRR